MTLPTVPADRLNLLFFQDICQHVFVDPALTRVEHGDGSLLGTAFTPSPDLNLLYLSPGAREVSTLVGAVVERLHTLQLPFLCGVSPDAAGRAAAEQLVDQGLRPLMTLPIMTLNLQELREADAQIPGLTLTRVHTEDEWHAWCEVTADAFDFTPEMRAVTEAALRRPALDPTSRAWFYVGWHEGVPVGSALTVLGEVEVGAWCIGTVKAARGRGVGAAMTTGPLLAARGAGQQRARLGATAAGFPVYTRLGWRVEQEMPFYLFAPDGSPAHP